MCTAITYQTTDFYFGRTLDVECAYGEELVFTPRNFPLRFRHVENVARHHAILGMASVAEGYPLYFDAVNECGLGMAGLRFAGNAVYGSAAQAKENVAVFELIPWILGRCATIVEAKAALAQARIVDTAFSAALPNAPLHWMIADRTGAVVVEAVADGLHIYDNPVGVLTNNPPFPEQLSRLNDYMHLSPRDPANTFSNTLPLARYSRGMGAIGLPGDLSSASRFVRAAFVRANAQSDPSERASVHQFFHILGAVEQPRGCCELAPTVYEITRYTTCCNATRGIYYYTTYDNHRIAAVDMQREALDGTALSRYPLITDGAFYRQN
jgi:choloylglycine hydrolase